MARRNGNYRIHYWIANGIAITVMLVWAVSFLCAIFVDNYNPSKFLHLALVIVAGAAFHEGRKRLNGNGEGGSKAG